MPHQDTRSDIVINHRTLKQVVDLLLVPALFAGMKTKAEAAWKPRMLATAALVWVWSNEMTLGERFEQAKRIVGRIFRWHSPPGNSYQGFVKMLRTWNDILMAAIIPHLRELMSKVLPWEKIAGFIVFAVDGSKTELARTKSLENEYSPAKQKKKKKKTKKTKRNPKRRKTSQRKTAKGSSSSRKKQSAAAVSKKADSPQMWLTLLWHVRSGLPWAWKTGPSDSSERGHLEEMLPELPEKSLITADAGFVGYDFWKTILDGGHNFLARVGGNVSLLKNLGCARQHEHTVYLWPDTAAKKQQPPLVLRLIVVHNGKHPVYLVTNLNKSQLSDRQAVEVYRARWGIEVFFRTFKQTFGRRKLRSRSAQNAQLEMDWSLLGLWCVCLLGQRELAERGKDPARLSPAAAIRAIRMTLRDWRVRPERSTESLWNLLGEAVRDNYTRTASKTSRVYPRKKQRQATRPPKIAIATSQQVVAAKRLIENESEFRLTA